MTIRPLGPEDLEIALALLAERPEYNLYTLSNLKNLGFETDYCQYWGDFSRDGRLRAVLNRYRDGWTISGQQDAAWLDLGTIVDNHSTQTRRLQDNPGGVGSFLPYLRRYRPTRVLEEELMRLRQGDFRPVPADENVLVRRATSDDLPRLTAFYADAGPMTRSPERVKEVLRFRRIWIGFDGEEVGSAALTNGELTRMAMVGGVFTRPDSRNRGLSQIVVSRLCQELLAEGRMPVLYWENPAAGAVYRKIGFQPIGVWRSIVVEKKSL